MDEQYSKLVKDKLGEVHEEYVRSVRKRFFIRSNILLNEKR